MHLEWISAADTLVAAILAPLAILLLLSGLDDLLVDIVWLWKRGPDLPAAPPLPGRIAVMIPLWHEHEVIEQMLAHNLAAIGSTDFDVFAGCYPNDRPTQDAVLRARQRDPRVRLALCPAPGPTSKADCLNAIWRAVLDSEQQSGIRYDVFVMHDAEDLIHPGAFDRLREALATAAMAQVPVLALPTPLWEPTHGIYCDEFAEYQTRDMQVRQRMGAFVPSTGVGTGFRRDALEALAEARNGLPFEPESLTEDYECGLRLHRLGLPQCALPVRFAGGAPVATREYFPRRWRSAVRQRTRWVMGNALQSWERHGWRGSAATKYWLWRDRKGLLGNPLSLLANLLLLYGAAVWLSSRILGSPWSLHVHPLVQVLWPLNLALAVERIAVRAWCSARIYGWRFASGVPVRQLFANCLNTVATAMALFRFTAARWQRRRLQWLKTDHLYPSHAALAGHKRSFEEVMLSIGLMDSVELDEARRDLPEGTAVGPGLLDSGRISEQQYYHVLSLQSGVPLEFLPDVPSRYARALPARIMRELRVVPFRVEGGALHVASPDPPSDAVVERLKGFTGLRIAFHLVPETRFQRLTRDL